MKALNKYIIPAVLLFSLAACEDEQTPVLGLQKKAEFNPMEVSAVAINKSNLTEKFPKISWSPADYNGASVSYTVKLKSASTGKEVVLGETVETFLELDNSAVNTISSGLGALPGIEGGYTVSLVSSVPNTEVSDEAENTLDLKIQPYDSKSEGIDWNYAYVAVNYPDFDFEKSYIIGDPEGDGTYQGYVNIPEGAESFAILDGKTLEVISQDNTLSSDGFVEIVTDADGGINISEKTEWGLVGSATSGGWDKDTKMEFDEKTGLWTVVTSLIEGEFKFRANGGWDINYGKGSEDFTLAPGGDNIKITNAHAYIITLNLANAGKYTYSLEETDIQLSSSSLTLPGTFNDWNKATKDYVLTSEARDFIFDGVVYIDKAPAEFKFYDDGEGTWLGIAGDMAEDGSFKIGESDGENIKLEKAGYYKITVDQKKMTASIVATGWELIGDAMEFGWDKGIVMDYDPETKIWSKTITVKAGKFKFRWAGSWDINFGGELTGLTQGGADIPISAGTYKIVLDPENATASVTKQ
ncbi:MAG: SusF/SusE family outer membrane protein [Bacteroidales bacterium]|nr:SusF/SusE family outer membrane protein [Bacteroidales bacterium]